MDNSAADVAAWLLKADHDLLNIRNNLAAELVPWDTLCFHAQQAVEKTLKALLVQHNRVPPKTHDLGYLLDLCAEHEPTLVALQADCDSLSGAAVLGRYPDYLLEPDEASSRPLLAAMQRVLAALNAHVRGA